MITILARDIGPRTCSHISPLIHINSSGAVTSLMMWSNSVMYRSQILNKKWDCWRFFTAKPKPKPECIRNMSRETYYTSIYYHAEWLNIDRLVTCSIFENLFYLVASAVTSWVPNTQLAQLYLYNVACAALSFFIKRPDKQKHTYPKWKHFYFAIVGDRYPVRCIPRVC